MFQQFNTDTLMGRVIKNILATEKVPLFNCIDEGDVIVENCFYIYKHYVIKAITTGTFNVGDAPQFFAGHVHRSSTAENPVTSNFPANESSWKVTIKEDGKIEYKHVDGFVDPTTIDYSLEASYQVVECNCYDTDKSKYMFSYHSKTNYYDSDTHYHLGNYLRFYNSKNNINLMPFYNCYSGDTLANVTLTEQDYKYWTPEWDSDTAYLVDLDYGTPSYSQHASEDKRCYAVPIRFGKEYTIAIDSDYPVILRPIVYKDGRMVRASSSLLYSDFPELEGATTSYSSTKFKHPFTFRVNTNSYKLKQRERYLLLAIQVDTQVKSSLVVLEGNYTSANSNQIIDPNSSGSTVSTDSDAPVEAQALSLLQVNTRESFAFSDRLIEYLLQNVICSTDQFDCNIRMIQDIVSQIDNTYSYRIASKEFHPGVWDDRIPKICEQVLQQKSHKSMLWDQDGNINKDLEGLLLRVGGGL